MSYILFRQIYIDGIYDMGKNNIMVKSVTKGKNTFIVLTIACLLLIGVFLPVTQATSNIDYLKGFDKGSSSLPVVPLKKTTMVQLDKETLLDDYAYLACVPTAVFNSGEKLFSYPLLFYEDEYKYQNDWERTLDARQGLDYFMEDWMSYCNGQLDQMTLINVPVDKLDSDWKALEYVSIDGDNPFDIAGEIVLQDWSYSDNAVVAVIQEEYEKPERIIEGRIQNSLPISEIDHKTYEMKRPTVGVGGNYQTFEITDYNYKYLVVNAEWNDPSFDVDMQIFDDQLGMLSSNMNPSWKKGEAKEIGGSYIRNYGTWEIGLTAFPKKTLLDGEMKSQFQIEENTKTGLFSKLFKKDIVNVDVMFYPGIDIEITDLPPFGCRDVEFTLEWDNSNVELGFTIVDPSGAEIASSFSSSDIIKGDVLTDDNSIILNVSMLGECIEEEKYIVSVYALNDIDIPVKFTVDYNFKQKYTRKEGNGLSSASNGAVLASKLNAPLLYTKPSSLPEVTSDVLYKLGVENIYIVNLGGHLEKDVKEKFKEITSIKKDFTNYNNLYDFIKEDTDIGDVVFTTIEPWAEWYVYDLLPNNEEDNLGELFIGPAAFVAAHHTTPVIITDMHPKLSKAVVYHKDFWVKNAPSRPEASAGDMIVSGRQVYDFLEEYGFDKSGNNREESMETIITVAGQFNIGPSWDRTFVGKALSGRFHFSPTDTAYWISRDIFYPCMIFENPGMEEVKLWQGSESTTKGILGGPLGLGNRIIGEPKGITLKITKPTQEEFFSYPILQTYVSGAYKFNEQASNHWGTMYTRADGITPYIQPSPDNIDVGATDKVGAYYPDLDDTEVIPFYANKAGYGNVFSTNFEKVVENLNRGVLMWIQDSHGYHRDSGIATFWNPDSPYIYEENPWRAYEPVMLKLGHSDNFIRWVFYMLSEYMGMETLGKLAEFEPIKFQLFPEVGSTENPDGALYNPSLSNINRVIEKTTGGMLEILGAFGFKIHWDRLFNNPNKLPLITTYDGMITTSTRSGSGIIEKSVNGILFDDELDNLHSCGINTVVCLPAGTYLQMSWIRHGASYTIMDPWGTSDYCAVWLQSIIKNLALGDTIGQAYEKGVRSVGPEYLVDHWWWDMWENVCYYGDPDLRVFVPGTEYSDANHWTPKETQPLMYDEEININGHMPFGAAGYPHEKQPESFLEKYFWYIVIIVIVILIILALAGLSRRKNKFKI